MSDDGKFFILGVGAQKAGTTWLARQLEKTSFFSNAGIKEFHIFNKLFTNANSKKNPYKFIKKANINAIIKRRYKKGREPLISPRVAMRLSPSAYFDFFDYLYLRQPDISHVGDITPAYSTLSSKTFSLIRDGLIAKNFQTKIIFLMRGTCRTRLVAAQDAQSFQI